MAGKSRPRPGKKPREERNLRVLLADDDARFREVTSAILEKRGFAVSAVSSLKEAARAVEKGEVDVLVMEQSVGGAETAEWLPRLKRARPELEVIFLTGGAADARAMRAVTEGAFEFLRKPCPIEFLEEKIREAGGRGRGLCLQEKRVREVMVPLSSFSSVREDQTVAEAVEVITASYVLRELGPRVHEYVHRSILIKNNDGKVAGIVAFTDLLSALIPAWGQDRQGDFEPGMFTVLTRRLGQMSVREIMTQAPPSIDSRADLGAAARRMAECDVRRLLVTDAGAVIGVIREQDLFFEFTHVMSEYEQFLP